MEPIASASTSSTTITSISKVATNEMRKICSKHSELLLKLKRCKPSALPETYSYKDKSSTKLAADEHAMIETLQINSPPTYQWKEIEFTLKTNTKKPVLKNHPSNKADHGVKKADDSGFLENIQDFSQASSNMYTTIESTSQKKETNKGNKSVNSIHKGKGPQTKKVSVKVRCINGILSFFVQIFYLESRFCRNMSYMWGEISRKPYRGTESDSEKDAVRSKEVVNIEIAYIGARCWMRQ